MIWRNVDELGNRTFGGWTSNQIINFETEHILEGWDEEWNKDCNAQIVFGYTGE